jgi:hypothetical protein
MNRERQGAPRLVDATPGLQVRGPWDLAKVVVMRPDRSWWRKTKPIASVAPRDPYFVIDLDTGNS